MNDKLDQLSIDTIRSLCIDIINKAKSGHPGMALGSAPILYTLFTKHLVASPKEDKWINRDRFVLSAGHASSLLYSMLFLAGYNLTLDDLKSFRQLNSITAGHPEVTLTAGIDATAGPLGQGIAQAVGMALAERALSNCYPDADKLVNHYTYALCGDGCLQEGISQEAISFAGNQKLNKLILFYDSNNITLDGSIDLSNSEDEIGRFKSAGWNTIEVMDGNDVDSIDKAIRVAKKSKDKPTLILVHTIIGFGSANQGTNKVHGNPLGEEDGKHAKVDVYHFDHPDFFIPDEVKENFNNTFIKRGNKALENWNNDFVKFSKKHPSEAETIKSTMYLNVSNYVPDAFPNNFSYDKPMSTRIASQNALNAYMLSLPNLYGGSADVMGSVMTKLNNGVNLTPLTPQGHNINFGIREFAMSAIANGMLLHGGVRTYVGSFFVFSDYLRPAIRMAALSRLPNIFLFSHDSIAVGEDGPTHQPIEHLAALRCIPNVHVIRPCDEKETYGAWKCALLSKETPTCLIISRQNLPVLTQSDPNKVSLGAYIISKNSDNPKYLLLATGSEVNLAIQAQAKLKEEGINVNVISMPSQELFNKQDDQYKKEVLSLDRDHIISVEMLSSFGWDKYSAHHYSIDDFGKSGKADDVINDFGFTVDKLVEFVKGIK